MKSETLFISDLHLSAVRPAATRRFLDFIRQQAQGAERLFILGDLFDAYIGDDDNSTPNREIKAALRQLNASGTQLFFQHGNRDFLVGERFCRETGASLLEDYSVIDLYGEAALITHGDLLCTDDLLYQSARVRVRAPEWKRRALSKPLLLRQLYARWYRLKSHLDKRKKSADIMDANQQAVAETLRHFGVTTLIHGHTHRPGLHAFEIDHQPARRFVLAEWGSDGSILRWRQEEGWSVEKVE